MSHIRNITILNKPFLCKDIKETLKISDKKLDEELMALKEKHKKELEEAINESIRRNEEEIERLGLGAK